MNATVRTIAKAVSVAAFGMFALAPGVALAAPGPGIAHMGSGGAGGGDSHGRGGAGPGGAGQQAPAVPSAGNSHTGPAPQFVFPDTRR